MTALPGPSRIIDGIGYLDGVPIRPEDNPRFWEATCRVARMSVLHGAAFLKREAWERRERDAMPAFLRDAIARGEAV